MKKILIGLLVLTLAACNVPAGASAPTPQAAATQQIAAPPTEIPAEASTEAPTETPLPSDTPIPSPTATPLPTETSTATPVPVVESLDATVTADLLSCRYGPGAEYLYFYAFSKGNKLKLTGRADASNWVIVSGLQHLCWVNAKFIEIKGDPKTLKITYPGEYKLPVSPYYTAPIVLSATRSGGGLTVQWSEIALRAGDEEDANMFIYIIEVWRCEGGQIVFDALASNYPEVTFVDESGCDTPSHGRVFFQEKHGFAGPAEIPWP
jgi:uncharacterized protein YraI